MRSRSSPGEVAAVGGNRNDKEIGSGSSSHNNDGDDGAIKKKKSVGEVVAGLGFSTFQIRFTMWMNLLWALSGVTSSAVPFLLDAGDQRFGLSVEDRSFILVGMKTNGLITGAICGLCGDMFGRAVVIQWVLLWGAICFCVLSGLNSIVAFGTFMVLVAAGRDGYVNVTNPLISEWMSPKNRVWAMMLPHASWNVGRGFATAMWAIIRPDRAPAIQTATASGAGLQFDAWNGYLLSVAIPAVLISSAWWLYGSSYESPSQSLLNGRNEKCVALLENAAKVNGEAPLHLDPDEICLKSSSESNHGTTSKSKRDVDFSLRGMLRQLTDPRVAPVVACLSCVMFGLSFAGEGAFQWLIEYFREINKEEAITPTSVVAPVARVLTILGLIWYGPDRVPRVLILRTGMALMTLFMFLTTITSAVWLITIFVFFENVFEEFVWSVAALYASEAFPTSVRATAYACAMVFASLGSLFSSSFTGEIMELWGAKGGIYTLSIASLVGFIASMLLPARDMRGKLLIDLMREEPRRKYRNSDMEEEAADESETTSLLNR